MMSVCRIDMFFLDMVIYVCFFVVVLVVFFWVNVRDINLVIWVIIVDGMLFRFV